MTPEESVKRFQKLLRTINRELPAYIKETTAHNAAVFVFNRVHDTGRDFRGVPFKPYSTKPMLTSGTTSKGKNVWRAMGSAETRKRGLNWVTIKRQGRNIHLFELKGGYRQLRRLEGLQTGYKDFSFSSVMWNSYGVKRTVNSKGKVVVTIGGKTQDSQDRIDWNSKREGVEIINISDQELKILAKQIDQQMQKYINKVGLS